MESESETLADFSGELTEMQFLEGTWDQHIMNLQKSKFLTGASGITVRLSWDHTL